MQLKDKRKVRQVLGAAACALLGSAAQAADKGWDVESAVLFYAEPDRVSAIEPMVSAKKEVADDEYLNLKLTLDTLTGSSANGATPSAAAQTFTAPSGKGSYTTPAGQTPLDDTFHDTRVAVSANWDRPLGRDMRYNLGANVSKEYDYFSIGASGQLSKDLNNKNTTISAGASFAFDTINPEGGIPTPWASFTTQTATRAATRDNDHDEDGAASLAREGDSDTKTTADLLFGITQVLGKNTIGQVNLSFSQSSGYQTDPFKIVSLIDPATALTLDYLYESRPDSRQKTSLYAGLKHNLVGNIISGGVRMYSDDWGITSGTVDLAYRMGFGGNHYLQPRVRYYTQTAADFYTRYLVDGDALPTDVSADYRLGEFDASTVGLKYGYKMDNGSEFSVRGEYYLQSSAKPSSERVAALSSLDLYPDVDAYILQLNYSLHF